MPTTTPTDNIRSFLPIFYISKVFGCNLYSLPSSTDISHVNASVSAFDVLMCLIHFGLYLFVCMPLAKKWDSYDKVFSNEFASNMGSSGMVVIVFLGDTLLYVASIRNMFIVVMDMINSANMRRIMLTFIEFDAQMTEAGVKVDASHKRIPLLYGLATLLWQFPTIWLSVVIAEGTGDNRIIFIVATYIGHTVLNGCQSSYLISFWYILENLADRFRAINNCLRRHVTNTNGSESSSSNDSALVRTLSINHLKLVEMVETVSQANAVQFVLSIATFFVSVTVTTFMTYQVLHHSIHYGTPGLAAYFTVRLFHNFFLLYKIVSVGSKIRKERNITQSLVNKAIVSQRSSAVSLQLKRLSYQIRHSEMTISCGLFTIDWTLLYTLTTALGTYLLLFESFNSIHIARN